MNSNSNVITFNKKVICRAFSDFVSSFIRNVIKRNPLFYNLNTALLYSAVVEDSDSDDGKNVLPDKTTSSGDGI